MSCLVLLQLLLLVITWLGVCTVYVWRAERPIPVNLGAFQRAREALGIWTYEELVRTWLLRIHVLCIDHYYRYAYSTVLHNRSINLAVAHVTPRGGIP